jgi:hypothetical protein
VMDHVDSVTLRCSEAMHTDIEQKVCDIPLNLFTSY